MALIMLLLFAFLPNSTVQVAFTFHSKIHILCILVALLARVNIAGDNTGSAAPVKTISVGTGLSQESTGSQAIDGWEYKPMDK